MISVLYVDDEPTLLEVCKIFLERRGEFSVATETSPVKALERLEHEEYDVIVSDYQMPELDGISFLKRFRVDHPKLPFLIFTGKGREEIAVAAYENGADFYIQKGGNPVAQFADLSHKIHRAFEQRAAERALAESETRFRALIQNASDIIRILGRDGRILYDSPAASRTLGFPEQFFIGKDPLDFIHPDDRGRVTADLGLVRDRTNMGRPTEFRIRRADGEYIDVESVAVNLFGTQGIDGIVVTTRVITDRKRAEAALAESRRAFETLIANLPGMVYRCRNDQDWTMEFVSGGCRELTGYDPAELVGNTTVAYGSLVVPEDRKAVWEQVQDAIGRKGPFQMAYRITDRAGHTRWVWEQGRGVFDDAGNLLALEGYIADISSHKHAEEALRMTNRKLQLLSGITRHDIQNQLTTLRGALALVSHEQLDPQSKKLIGTAEKAAGTIGSQIEFTKEYEHLGVREPRWQDITGVFRSAARHFLMCDVALELAAEGYEIYADPLLEKVFYNLIDNAFRHGGDVTRISLSVTGTGGSLVVTFEDDGRGIPDADKPLIFEQDFGKNTGLGLFLSRDILSITGISIAENGKYGEGARFVITVPEGAFRPAPED
ncbi:MAG TPA: PAS domain S-box protein [Methanoregula sp.]|nr:PAS domain S-box protein [Methanoregula sp.]